MKNRTVLSWFAAAVVVVFGRGEAVSQTDFWQKTNSPLGRTVGSVASNASSDVFAGTDNGVFRTSDNGGTWTNAGLNPGGISWVITSRGAIFAGDSAGSYYTTDNGANWRHFTLPFWIRNAIAINDSGEIFIGWGNEFGGGIERSTDNGANWVDVGLRANSYALAINASGTIFSGGWYSVGACVFRSTDNGLSWSNTGLSAGYGGVTSLAISPAGHIFVGTSSDGVVHSTDNGAHWIQSTSGMRTSFVTRLAINSNGHIFAGTFSEGVYRSTDDGANWTTVNSGLTNDTVVSIAINASGTIFAVTQNGFFRSVQSTTSVRERIADAPVGFSLDQNYPNPFNPSTNIRYAVPHRAHVTLTVFNTLGQQVATPVNADIEAGYHEVQFDAGALASGVYFYRLVAGSFADTKRFMILK